MVVEILERPLEKQGKNFSTVLSYSQYMCQMGNSNICTSLWLAFLASVQQGRVLDCTFIVLNSTSTSSHLQKYTRSLQNMDASIFWTHSGGPKVSAELKYR